MWVLLIFVCKELCMGLGGLLIHRRAKVEIPPSNIFGKTATVLFFIICVALIVFPDIPHTAAIAMICVCLAASLLAFATYIKRYIGIMKAKTTGD